MYWAGDEHRFDQDGLRQTGGPVLLNFSNLKEKGRTTTEIIEYFEKMSKIHIYNRNGQDIWYNPFQENVSPCNPNRVLSPVFITSIINGMPRNGQKIVGVGYMPAKKKYNLIGQVLRNLNDWNVFLNFCNPSVVTVVDLEKIAHLISDVDLR
jgi:hypothetical protein